MLTQSDSKFYYFGINSIVSNDALWTEERVQEESPAGRTVVGAGWDLEYLSKINPMFDTFCVTVLPRGGHPQGFYKL
jgi:hypothetical protein